MLRHLDLIVVCACLVASVGCDDGGRPPTAPTASSSANVRVEFGGRVVNADAGGPVEGVRVSLSSLGSPGGGLRTAAGYAEHTARSSGDGTFTLPLDLPMGWRSAYFQLTAPPGYDDTSHSFEPPIAADRPAIRMYPTLVIRPGESIDVRVDNGIVWCGWGATVPCRRVLVAASPGDPVELEVVAHDSSKPMAVGLATPEDLYISQPDMSVRRIVVAPGSVPYVMGVGAGRLTARR